MKSDELRPCALCGHGVGHTGLPLFWRVTTERFGIERHAVNQAAGMEQIFGGAVALARVCSDPDIAAPIGEQRTLLVCEACAGQATSIYQLGLPE